MEDTYYAGRWWRADAYELRGGYIAPVAGAAFTPFDPLDDFQDARAGRGETASPYLALINLVDRIALDARGELTADSRSRLLAWCDAYGLLGLLLHRVQQATFAPRWERRRGQPAGGDHAPTHPTSGAHRSRPAARGEELFATHVKYLRSNWGSFRWGKEQELTQAVAFEPRKEGRIVERSRWVDRAGRVLLHDADIGEWRFEPLDATWARFFPSVEPKERLTFAYPQPYSEPFWSLYAESVVDFITAARTLRDAFLAAAAFKNPTPDADGVVPDIGRLNALVAPVGPCVLRLRGGDMEQRSVSPSLFGSLVIMAQQDLATDRRVIRCHNRTCGLIVVAVGYQTKFCSPRCRHAEEKREQRARSRLAAAAGMGQPRSRATGRGKKR